MDIKVRGSKGTLLAEDDDVTLIKDLKPKGSSTVLERGTMIGNIQLTDDPAEIEGRTDNIKRQASGAACGVFEEGMTDGVETIVRLCKPGLIVRRYFWLARLINERGNVFGFGAPSPTLQDALNRDKPILYIRLSSDPFEDLA